MENLIENIEKNVKELSGYICIKPSECKPIVEIIEDLNKMKELLVKYY